MPFSTFRGAACAAVIALAPTMASAQEVFGTITASLDGAERAWFLTSNDDESQTFGMTMAVANLQSFTRCGDAFLRIQTGRGHAGVNVCQEGPQQNQTVAVFHNLPHLRATYGSGIDSHVQRMGFANG